MRIGSRIMYPLVVLILSALAGCYPADGGTQARSDGIPVPAGLLSLSNDGTLSVRVFLDDEATPRFSNNDVDSSNANIQLEFASPEGTHTFTVLFEYFDPEFVREDARPWELARWSSGPVEVTAGEDLALNITDYTFEDYDEDGLSNAVELSDRTDPADSDDPGVPGDPVIIPPDGLWRGGIQDQAVTDIIAILHGNRIIMMNGEAIYDGIYVVGAQGDFTGSVDIYTLQGDKLTASARADIIGARLSETNLTLNVNAAADTVQAHTINLTFDTGYERDSALALIARTWEITIDDPPYVLSFPVDSNGTLTGATDTDGCLYAGILSVVDTRYNVYGVSLLLADQTADACAPFTGAGYTGYASLIPDDNTLLIIVSNESHALSFELAKSGSPPKVKPKKPRPNPKKGDDD
jgi:hypothetical protein